MKRLTSLCIALLFASLQAMAQQTENNLATHLFRENVQQASLMFHPANSLLSMQQGPDNRDYSFYNKRSRTHRIIGLSLLGGGVVLGLSGVLVVNNENSNDYTRDDNTASTLFVLSAATGIASIPFMILAHANKSKAKAALKTQGAYIPGKGIIPVTGLSLSLSIGR